MSSFWPTAKPIESETWPEYSLPSEREMSVRATETPDLLGECRSLGQRLPWQKNFELVAAEARSDVVRLRVRYEKSRRSFNKTLSPMTCPCVSFIFLK